jgi:hypothetical protein
MDAASTWPWLRAQVPVAPLGQRPQEASPCHFAVGEGGTLTIRLEAARAERGGTFALEGLFPPAPWGPSTARIGMQLVLTTAEARLLLELAARDLQVDAIAPSPVPAERGLSRSVRVEVHRRSADEAAAFGAWVTLFTMEKPRAEVGFDIAFVETVGTPSNGWIRFRGPKGKKSRSAALGLLAAFFTPDEDTPPGS